GDDVRVYLAGYADAFADHRAGDARRLAQFELALGAEHAVDLALDDRVVGDAQLAADLPFLAQHAALSATIFHGKTPASPVAAVVRRLGTSGAGPGNIQFISDGQRISIGTAILGRAGVIMGPVRRSPLLHSPRCDASRHASTPSRAPGWTWSCATPVAR